MWERPPTTTKKTLLCESVGWKAQKSQKVFTKRTEAAECFCIISCHARKVDTGHPAKGSRKKLFFQWSGHKALPTHRVFLTILFNCSSRPTELKPSALWTYPKKSALPLELRPVEERVEVDPGLTNERYGPCPRHKYLSFYQRFSGCILVLLADEARRCFMNMFVSHSRTHSGMQSFYYGL